MKLRLWARKLARSDVARALAIHLSLFGIATGVLEGWHLKAAAGAVLLVAIPVTTYVVKWLRAAGQIPSSAIEDLLPVKKHGCSIPPDPITINSACRLAERHFGGANIGRSDIIGMYDRNRYSLVTLTCDQMVVAYADFFILYPECLGELLSGTLDEPSMRASMTAPIEDFRRIRSLYLAGIVVKEPNSGHGGRRAAILLWASCKLLLARYFTDSESVTFYAEGYSDEGVMLLERLGFDCIDDRGGRKSGNPLYSRTLYRHDIEDWLRSHPDWSTVCELQID